jgi:prolyl 4-hydroxylase
LFLIVNIDSLSYHDSDTADEECDRLIELGNAIGFDRSTEYASTSNADGSTDFVESKGRTSTNTFCQEGCEDDPLVEGVIARMTQMTSIPYDNFEHLQLVKYEEGQFYNLHHDFSKVHETHPYGPRILTFFLYLNDVEGGGGTRFDELGVAFEPRKGMALVWPSMTDDLAEMDDWTWHEALPVSRGTKYGANTWIHLRDYQNTPDYC